MIKKDNIYIYKTTNLINGKIYIGQHASNNKKDIYLGSGTYILKAIKKYGKENFKKEILYNSIPCRYHLDLKEQEYINKFNSLVPNGYNISIGGNGSIGFTHSDETKRKLSEMQMGRIPWNKGVKSNTIPWNKGLKYKQKKFDKTYFQTIEFKERMKLANTGKIMSEETRNKISNTLKGKIFSEETKQKLKESFANLELIECPFCKKQGKPGIMKRWHFVYCKENPDRLEYKEQKKPTKIECPYCGFIGGSNIMHRFHMENCKYNKNN